MLQELPNVAFKTPAGEKVIIVLNNSQTDKAFSIALGDKSVIASLAAGAVSTYVWP